MTETKLFGYWLPVYDEDGARHAVRMAGPPALLMGANVALVALIFGIQPAPNAGLITSLVAAACLLMLLALRIRGGHAAWIPFTVILFVVFLTANAFLTYLQWQVLGLALAGLGLSIVTWFIAIVCLALSVSGLRGWQWLKSHNSALSF